ncbi:hypothetical protein KAU43_01755 [candidate division WOR-3 bacterium]|jgi:hypothetical protein|nr:hypothetical protein [candidate division WOR-3 bacterium]
MEKNSEFEKLRNEILEILSEGKKEEEIEKFIFIHDNGEIGTFFDKSIVNINVINSKDNTFIIDIYANLIFNVTIVEKLLGYLLTLNSKSLTGAFNLIVNEKESNLGIVSFSYAFMIKSIDREIFLKSFFTVGEIANYYAKEIQAKFGGLTINEYIKREDMPASHKKIKDKNKGEEKREESSKIEEIWE